jgi:hypothetical protein
MANNNETQRVTDTHNNTVSYIDPNQINLDKFGLDLFGDSVSELSPSLNKNFVTLAQNFYGENQPVNPVIGQVWFNKTDGLSYRWMGATWIQVDKDFTYDSFMFVKYDIGTTTEFVLDEFVFNLTRNNTVLYNQNLKMVKFIIDPFDSRKIILKESNITTLYILVFHPRDRISNPAVNKKMEIFTESGQTQFDIDSLLDGTNINTLSVALNDIMLRSNEFDVVNNILTINGMIYRVRKDDKLTVWTYGGSLTQYYTNFKIHTNRKESFIRVPKFFKNIVEMEIVDIDANAAVNPIDVTELDDYIEFEFLDKKNIIANIYARII